MTLKEYKAAYYQSNKEKIKSAARKNYSQNKERALKTAKIWAQANKDKVQASNKRWAEKNPEKFADIKKAYDLKKVGWTLESYRESEQGQKGLCAICKEPQRSKMLAADHDHETNAPRELLCDRCNLMLGGVADSPTLLDAAAAYLRKW